MEVVLFCTCIPFLRGVTDDLDDFLVKYDLDVIEKVLRFYKVVIK